VAYNRHQPVCATKRESAKPCFRAGSGQDRRRTLQGIALRTLPQRSGHWHEYLAVFLKNPQAFIPGTPMKISELWEEEVQALVAYLMSLK
jgi:cytochrome c1